MRVLVLRPAGRADSLMRELRARGLAPVHHPLVDFEHERLSLAADLAGGVYDWLVLTSVTTLGSLPVFTGVEQPFRVACVGPATARAAQEAGLRVDRVADGSGAALTQAFPPGPGRIAFPASSEANTEHAAALERKGWSVDRIVAYRPVIRPLPPELVSQLRAGRFGAVILTSPMMAREILSLEPQAALIAIGEPTARAVRTGGRTCVVAADTTDSALADAAQEVA